MLPRLLLAVATLAVASLTRAQTSTDDFSTSTNWTAPFSAGNATLAISGGRANYTTSSPAANRGSFIAWTRSTFPYTTSWEAQVDVHARAASAAATIDYFYGSLSAFRTGDAYFQTTAADKPRFSSMSADIIRPGGATNGFQLGYSRANDDFFELPASPVVNGTTDAALRITFDATTKVMTAWFDANGATGGYTWTSIASIDIDGAQNFGMTAADTFTIALSVSSGRDIVAAGDVYFDNFSATLITASAAPTISAQPAAKTIASGSTVVFSVAADGAPAPTYQWRRGTTAIAGETNSTLVLSGAAASAGNYNCVVTNSAGSVTSADALLTVSNVAATDVGRLINLSVLAPTGPGARLLTMGATVGGTGAAGALPLVIRGVGPTLGTFGVGGVLADPVLSIFPAGSATASVTNDNWGGTPALVAAFDSVGAFALPAASLDSAALQNQAAGGFTVQVAGKGAAAGTVIAEVYDAAGATRTATTPRLTNLSTLTSIGAAETLSAGFVIRGSTARTVLVRAVGPTLGTAFSIAGAMADPKLELFNNDTSAKIAENDNWAGAPWLASTHTAVGAFALGGVATRDASLVITLAPGAYSARVSGVNGGSGTAIIEVYEVP